MAPGVDPNPSAGGAPHDPSGVIPPASLDLAAALDRPFPGLRSFESHESFLFFGRRAHTAELLGRLAQRRFLAVVGSSGSGKSSLVRAGLLPALYRGYLAGAGSRWRIAVLRPGESPVEKLAVALASADVLPDLEPATTRTRLERSSLGLVRLVKQSLPARDSLLVVVDQFEELFRFRRRSGDGAGAEEHDGLFVRSLLEASDQLDVPIYVVLTMRSDFLGDCAVFRGLPEALNDSQYLIPRLTRAERQEAIEGPLRLAQVEITPRLVQRILNDAGDEPDQLPVMQHALLRTFRIWQQAGAQGPIDLEHYRDAGGMRQALHLHAETAYQSLPDEAQRRLAERAFRALTTLRQGRAVRRPCSFAHLAAVCGLANSSDSDADPAIEQRKQELRGVVRAFSERDCSFVLSSDGDQLDDEAMIDISHESLIRKWRRLGRWVGEESRSAEYYHDVHRDALLMKKGKAGPWRQPKLGQALELYESGVWNPSWAEQYQREGESSSFTEAMAFLELSRQKEAEEVEQEETRRNQEIADARRLASAQAKAKKWLTGAVALLVLLLVGTMVAAVWIARLDEERQASELRADELADQVAMSKAEAENAQENADTLRTLAADLERTDGTNNELIQKLEERIANYEAESKRLRKRAQDIEEVAAKDPVASRRDEIGDLEAKLVVARKELDALKNRNQTLDKALTSARAELAELSDLRTRYNRLERRFAILTAESTQSSGAKEVEPKAQTARPP